MKQALLGASEGEIPKWAKDKPNVGCVIHRPGSKGASEVLVVACNSFLPNTDEDTLKYRAAENRSEQHALTKELGVHAEINALQKWPMKNLEDATVYVTHVPCTRCTRALLLHRVKRVFYLFWIKKSEKSIDLFRACDISCIPFSKESRNAVLSSFKNTFLEDHNICKRGTERNIPKDCSFYLSTKDLTSGTSDNLKRSVSGDESLKVDKILQEIHEYKKQHIIKIVGVPEKSPEKTAQDTSSLCVSLFTALGAEITLQDIDMAQRTAEGRNSNGPRPIICKFVRQLARDSVMSVQHQACNVNPGKIGFSEDTDVSKISICNYDEDSQEMTEGASSTE